MKYAIAIAAGIAAFLLTQWATLPRDHSVRVESHGGQLGGSAWNTTRIEGPHGVTICKTDINTTLGISSMECH